MQNTASANKIRIFQHNCARSTNVINTLLQLAVNQADIIIIQEPWLKDNYNPPTHPSFQAIIPPKVHDRHPRVIAYISTTNQYLKITPRLDLTTDPDIQILDISTENIHTVQLYNMYNEQIPDSRLYTIERSLVDCNFPTECIVAGDMNAHHEWWDSSIQTPIRADTLVELMENSNFELLNAPNQSTYNKRTGRGSSILDLTFASQTTSARISNWAIDTDSATGSDHELICFTLISENIPTVAAPTTHRYNWPKADWKSFEKDLATRGEEDSKWTDFFLEPTEDNMELATFYLHDLIKESVSIFVPHLKPSPRSKT